MLGGGFAGSYVARLLKRRGATIVSLENFMLYTPLLPEAASGTLEPRHVVVPLRQMCPHAELLLGHVTRTRPRTEERRGRHARRTARDRVRAAGGRPRRPVPAPFPSRASPSTGWASRTSPTRSRSATTSCCSSSAPPSDPDDPSELGFVFVGAGYAGVESLGELNDMAHAALRFYPTLREVPQRWVLVDAAPKILPEIPRGLGRYAARRLAERGVEIHVGTMLESYDGTGGGSLERHAHSRADARLDGRRAGEPAPPRSSASPSTTGVESSSTRPCACREPTTCGRSATAPRSSTRTRRASSTRRRASTRCARHDGSRRT